MSDIEQYQDRGGIVTRDHQGEAVARLADWATSAQAAMAVATELSRSSFVPESFRNKPGEATAAILAGLEVGLQPMAALRSFDVIQGQAAARAITLRAIVQSHGHEIELVESTATRCKMRGRRRGSDTWQDVTWTMDRARALGVTNKPNWKNQPQAMLVARCTSEIARLIASDAILGIAYSSEEIADGAGAGVEIPAELTGTPDGEPPAPTGKKRMSRARKPAPAPVDAEVVDAELVDDEPTAPLADADMLAGLQRKIDELDTESKADLATWWKDAGHPGIKSGAMTLDHLAAVEAAVLSYLGQPAPSGSARNRKMHAMVAEAWPDLDSDGREKRRKALVAIVGDGAESSKALTGTGWDDLFVALDEITAGRQELHLKASGEFELRGKR